MTNKDCCAYLTESCLECQCIKKEDVIRENFVRVLIEDNKETRAMMFRKLVGGSL